MPELTVQKEIKQEFEQAALLHQRAVSDYAKCLEFNRIMANLLSKLEDCDNFKLAGKVMGILIECSPKEGSHCEQATSVENKMKKMLARQ